MAALFYLSSRPGSPQSLAFGFGDKIAHAVVFGILGLFQSFARLPFPFGSIKRVALVALVVTTYGISDELHQSFVPGRDASALDALANFIGGSVTAFSVVWWQRRQWR